MTIKDKGEVESTSGTPTGKEMKYLGSYIF